jgi:hypothetical protein
MSRPVTTDIIGDTESGHGGRVGRSRHWLAGHSRRDKGEESRDDSFVYLRFDMRCGVIYAYYCFESPRNLWMQAVINGSSMYTLDRILPRRERTVTYAITSLP